MKKTFILLAVLCFAISFGCVLTFPGTAEQLEPTPTVVTLPAFAWDLYLPAVLRPFTPEVGAQVENPDDLLNVYPGGLVQFPIVWAEVSPEMGDWNPPDLSRFAGYKLILTIKGAPAWAREPGSKGCAAPLVGYYRNYMDFVQSIYREYLPWGIAIWNEPDAPSWLVPDQTGFGCIDSPGTYADLVYLARHALPGEPVKIIAGEFLLDTIPSRYVELAFLNDLELSADIISFHNYQANGANTRVVEKLEYLRGFTDLPVALSETAINWGVCDPADLGLFEAVQVEYLRAVSGLDLLYLSWYTAGTNGWPDRVICNSDLVRMDGSRRPVWYLYYELAGRGRDER